MEHSVLRSDPASGGKPPFPTCSFQVVRRFGHLVLTEFLRDTETQSYTEKTYRPEFPGVRDLEAVDLNTGFIGVIPGLRLSTNNLSIRLYSSAQLSSRSNP